MGSGGQPRLGSLHAEGGRRRRPLEEMAELLSSSMLEGGREWRHPGWDVRRRQRDDGFARRCHTGGGAWSGGDEVVLKRMDRGELFSPLLSGTDCLCGERFRLPDPGLPK
jgi:hypothetical protein